MILIFRLSVIFIFVTLSNTIKFGSSRALFSCLNIEYSLFDSRVFDDGLLGSIDLSSRNNSCSTSTFLNDILIWLILKNFSYTYGFTFISKGKSSTLWNDIKFFKCYWIVIFQMHSTNDLCLTSCKLWLLFCCLFSFIISFSN